MEQLAGFAPDALKPPRFVFVVVNPAAGRGGGGRVRECVEVALRKAGCGFQLALTEGPGHASDLARDAATAGADRILVAGGDGTLHEVVQVCGPHTPPIGIVPVGTGNDVARSLGLPLAVGPALEVALHGAPRRMDLGRCNGRRFINVAGCGFDAAVADRVNRGFRWLTGAPAYVAAVAAVLRGYRAPRMRVLLNGEPAFDGAVMLVAVANTTSYGGGMRIAPDARVDDGLLDVCIVRGVGRLAFARSFPRVFRGTHTTHPAVVMLRGAAVRIESGDAPRLLVDGEVMGVAPADFAVEPLAAAVMVPRREGSVA